MILVSRPVLLALLVSSFAAAPSAQTSEAFSRAELEAKLGQDSWLPFLQRDTLTAGLYRLSAGAEDRQSPHARDEVYSILEGRAVLQVGSQRYDATPGALLFVAAGTEHRFVAIEKDLLALVFFSEAQRTRGAMAAGPRPTEQTPYDESSERGVTRSRRSWPSRRLSVGGSVRTSGRRWTATSPSSLGGVELGVGQYYLVLEHDADAGLRLLDPTVIRKARLDAFEASETTGGIVIPLELETAKTSATRLRIELRVTDRQHDRGELEIAFGPYRLRAPVALQPH